MTDIERLDERLTAVERAVVDGDYELDELADVAALADDVERIESRLDELEERVADVEARSEALGGFVSNVRSVNEDVEQQADSAIAAVDRLEARIDELEQAMAAGGTGESTRPARSATGTARHLDDPADAERTVDDIVAGTSRDRTAAGPATDGGQQGDVTEADQDAVETSLSGFDDGDEGGDSGGDGEGIDADLSWDDEEEADDDDDDGGFFGSISSKL